MTTEIELKYLILSDTPAAKIIELFSSHNMQVVCHNKQLNNCYFDTKELSLRKHDMGLRVRTNGSHIEQTIKTAGQVIGGLHSRPEYNVDIDDHFPNLSLFPEHIWQNTQSFSALQNEIVPLFTTDFSRSTWLVTDADGNIIELVLDEGEIISAERSEAIYELELELIEGDTCGLFNLAELLFTVLSLRPGIESKAARGYALWHNKKSIINAERVFLSDSDTSSIDSAFTQGLAHELTNLQKNIALFIRIESLDQLEKIKTNLAVIRHGFWLFEKHLPAEELTTISELSHFIHLFGWVDNAIHLQELITKTGNYRKKLEYSKQLVEQLKIEKRRFPNTGEIIQLLHSKRFNQLQLELLRIFIKRNHIENNIVEDDAIGVHQRLISFAREKIQQSLSEISNEMKSMSTSSCEQYIGLSKLLYRSLLTGTWLGGLFNNELRDKFRRPWLDMQYGISELQSLWVIQLQLEKLDEPPEKLVKWQASKVDSLLVALDNTKAMAIDATPYWHE